MEAVAALDVKKNMTAFVTGAGLQHPYTAVQYMYWKTGGG